MTNPHDEREQAAIDKIAALLERSSLGTPAARAARNRTPLSRGQRIADMKTSASDTADDLRQVTTAGYQSAQASTGQGQPHIRRGLTPARAWTNRNLLPADVMTTLTETNTADTRPGVASKYRSLFTTATGQEVTPWRIRTVAALDAVNTMTAQHLMIHSATSRRPIRTVKTSLVNRLQSTTRSLRSRWETRRIHHDGDCNRSVVIFIAGQGDSSSLLPDNLLPAFVDGGRRTASWWTAMSTGVDPSAGFNDSQSLSTGSGTLQAFVVYASRPEGNSGWRSLWHDIHADFLDESGHGVTWVPLVREQWGAFWKTTGVHCLGSEGVAEFVAPMVATPPGEVSWILAGGGDSSGVMRSVDWPLIIPSTLATLKASCLDIKRVSLSGERRAFTFMSRSDGLVARASRGYLVTEILRNDAQTVAPGRTLRQHFRLLNAEHSWSAWLAHVDAVLDGMSEVGEILVSQLGDVIKRVPMDGARRAFLHSEQGSEVLFPTPPPGFVKPLALDSDRTLLTDTPVFSKKLTG